jgi:hypothetical protein
VTESDENVSSPRSSDDGWNETVLVWNATVARVREPDVADCDEGDARPDACDLRLEPPV